MLSLKYPREPAIFRGLRASHTEIYGYVQHHTFSHSSQVVGGLIPQATCLYFFQQSWHITYKRFNTLCLLLSTPHLLTLQKHWRCGATTSEQNPGASGHLVTALLTNRIHCHVYLHTTSSIHPSQLLHVQNGTQYFAISSWGLNLGWLCLLTQTDYPQICMLVLSQEYPSYVACISSLGYIHNTAS